MNYVFPALAVAAVVILAVVFALVFKRGSSRQDRKQKSRKSKTKDRSSTLREANRKLSQNPKDPDALRALADLYFRDEEYENAFKFYGRLLPLCATIPELDEFEITLRFAQSAIKIKNLEEAYKSFMIARTLNQDNFEVNYNLGVLEFTRKNFQNSASYLNRARSQKPEHVDTNRYLGQSLHRIKRYKEAIAFLRKALEYEPEDKKTLFSLAQSHFEMGQNDFALKIFTHLRTDPEFGAQAALYSGTVHLNTKQYQKAVMDFEIGLRHENTPPPVVLELKYRLASASLQQGEIKNAIKVWNEILKVQPNYKDVKTQIGHYLEITGNRNLQIFLMSSRSEFVTLCRKIATKFYTVVYKNAATKLIDISLKNEYVDVLAEVNTRQWEDLVLFRFVRSTGNIGELILRELYSRIKELKAGRGICITSGTFSDSAKTFVEARLIDLLEKEDLIKLFKQFKPHF